MRVRAADRGFAEPRRSPGRLPVGRAEDVAAVEDLDRVGRGDRVALAKADGVAEVVVRVGQDGEAALRVDELDRLEHRPSPRNDSATPSAIRCPSEVETSIPGITRTGGLLEAGRVPDALERVVVRDRDGREADGLCPGEHVLDRTIRRLGEARVHVQVAGEHQALTIGQERVDDIHAKWNPLLSLR